MATCDPSTLLQQGKCLTCLTAGQLDIIETQLLIDIAAVLNPALDVTTDGILNRGKCLTCLTKMQRDIIKTQLLCDISGGT